MTHHEHKKVAFVLADMFEDSEFRVPYDRIRDAGHATVVVGSEAGGEVIGKRGEEKVAIELASGEADAAAFDALVIPGGYSPDKLRMDRAIVDLTRKLADAGKPVAAICHAGWLLAEADVVRGRTVTSYPSIRTDLENAGANWVDEEVRADLNLITSRTPDDLDALCAAILERL